jgi:hypothetical protein
VHEKRREEIATPPGLRCWPLFRFPQRIFTQYGLSIVTSARPPMTGAHLQTIDTNIRLSGPRGRRAYWRAIIRSLGSLRRYSGPVNNTVSKDASPMLNDAMGFPGWFLEASIA